ncbi:probable E3 ubiquitin-protein ligase TRIML1 isoform X1 [Monodelphis domestica]|uniref:probable E3 ubiquitin-protein ligase TRIML1 isoform X1 n=1 Tax=Monodelphis domestica TaxID=13616 RepID=UPI0024E1E022|nr:probable E3 ubiquitin-protein ligase TRIML1 isoform X1 [Monodelphis domestica]
MAADKCKKKLEETLNVLHEKEEELKAEYNDMGKQEEYFKKDTDFYKKLIRCEYRKMHGIIYNEENRNLQNLDQGIEDKLAKVEVNKAKLSPQIQHDNEKILEVEESLGYERHPGKQVSQWILQTDRLQLIIPEHFKSLKYRLDPHNQPDNEERLDYFVTVLGTETFTSGQHYWEVDVEGQTEWVLGICEDSVSKNENLSMSSEDVKATIGSKVNNQALFWSSEGCFYWIAANKLGIFLDYDEGNITFYNVQKRMLSLVS